MNLKEKLAALKATIIGLLAEAETFINESKFDEAKAKQTEIKSLREQVEVIKAQLDEAEASTEVPVAPPAKKSAARLPFTAPEVDEDEDEGDEVDGRSAFGKAVAHLRYGTVDAGMKAVMADLYGADYQNRRNDQMAAFVKYVRVGDARLTSKEAALLAPSAKNMMLRPETLAAEIKSGRMVSEIKATLEESSNDLGGYLVPEDYRTEIIQRLIGKVVVRGRARVVTTTRDAVEWPRLDGGNSRYTSAVRVTWVDETPSSATVASTNPTFGMLRVPVHTVMARTDLSRNLMEDSAFNLLDIMAGLFSDAMAIDEDEQFLIGTGGGKPQGVLGGRSGAEETAVSGVTTVTTGDASLLTDAGLINLVYSLDSQYRQNGVLVAAKNTYRDIRKIKDGEGRFVWQPGLTAGQPATVLGFAAFESEALPAVAATKRPIIFGDWGGYLIADRVGMSVERVSDSTTVGTNTVALFARRRLGGQVLEPWRFAVQHVSA